MPSTSVRAARVLAKMSVRVVRWRLIGRPGLPFLPHQALERGAMYQLEAVLNFQDTLDVRDVQPNRSLRDPKFSGCLLVQATKT